MIKKNNTGSKKTKKKASGTTHSKKIEPKKTSIKNSSHTGNAVHKPIPEPFMKDLQELAKAIEANPSLVEPIREIFEYHLVDPIDRKTFPKIVNAMSMILGPGPTMVIMTGCHVNSPAFFEDVLYAIKNDACLKAAVWTVQHLASIYGNRVQKAYTLSSGTMDEDWHSLDVNTFKREGENPIWIVDMRLTLYNGEETRMKMTPDSTYQLIEILMKELKDNIPEDQIDSMLVEKCEETITGFTKKYYHMKDCHKEENHPEGYA
ncbi:MAG TPA: hypothetical protein O0X32_00450 [Methanocorpusculum sp.]|nr:hypothetical protein [Methanocorpusculum sp.]